MAALGIAGDHGDNLHEIPDSGIRLRDQTLFRVLRNLLGQEKGDGFYIMMMFFNKTEFGF